MRRAVEIATSPIFRNACFYLKYPTVGAKVIPSTYMTGSVIGLRHCTALTIIELFRSNRITSAAKQDAPKISNGADYAIRAVHLKI